MKEGGIPEVLRSQAAYSLVQGPALKVLQQIPSESIDCLITSPPYWKQREYEVGDDPAHDEIGTEERPQDYVAKLVSIFHQARRILRPAGSLWLNLGDKYHNKNLMGMPWRVALAMQDNGWILRNDIIWDQMKGTQSPRDRLRDVYEHLFHFVKNKKYLYDADKIRIKPEKKPKINGSEVISATGVSGVKYRQQIAASVCLSVTEKAAALQALENTLMRVRNGELVDFRMTIRGAQRTYHGDNQSLSGRAKELEEKGFFVLTSQAKGYLPSDIWRIVPEDKWRKDSHTAVFPEELLVNPLNATCPDNGLVLDPFVGTGSTVVAGLRLGKRAIGIDLSAKYLSIARQRIKEQIVEPNGQFSLQF